MSWSQVLTAAVVGVSFGSILLYKSAVKPSKLHYNRSNKDTIEIVENCEALKSKFWFVTLISLRLFLKTYLKLGLYLLQQEHTCKQ